MFYYNFVFVNKSREKTKINNASVCLSVLNSFLFVAPNLLVPIVETL